MVCGVHASDKHERAHAQRLSEWISLGSKRVPRLQSIACDHPPWTDAHRRGLSYEESHMKRRTPHSAPSGFHLDRRKCKCGRRLRDCLAPADPHDIPGHLRLVHLVFRAAGIVSVDERDETAGSLLIVSLAHRASQLFLPPALSTPKLWRFFSCNE